MSNINVILDSASVQVIDVATSTYRVNSPVGGITLVGSVAEYQPYVLIAGGAGTAFQLPSATMWVVYIKNLDPVATLTARLQPALGAMPSAANSPDIAPGGVFLYWNPVETVGTGIIMVTLLSSVGDTYAEVLLAA